MISSHRPSTAHSLTRLRFSAITLILLALITPARADDLKTYTSRHYTVHTNLPRKAAEIYGRHIDAVYDAYQAMFRRAGMPPREESAFPLYLLQTPEQYHEFLAQHRINATNTGGLFFVQPDAQGLATFTAGRPVSETLRVLQHEGFHQFAYRHIGVSLPIWVNEGLAQYFEDGVLVGKSLHLGMASARRLATVRAAVDAGRELDFDQLLAMSPEQWQQTMQASLDGASLLYDQSWSIVFFLVQGDGGKYRKPFEGYLRALAAGKPSKDAFNETFGDQTGPFREAWKRWLAKAQPDPLPIALERMEFLGRGLAYLVDNDTYVPKTTAELRNRLQKVQFRATRILSGGATLQFDAQDEDVYRYALPNGGKRMFEVLEPSAAGLPPRLTAPGLKPEPTLTWSLDDQGKPQPEFIYR